MNVMHLLQSERPDTFFAVFRKGCCVNLRLVAIFQFLVISAVAAQSRLSQYGWWDANAGLLAFVLPLILGLGGLFGYIFASNHLRNSRSQKESDQNGKKSFDSAVARYNLDTEEVGKIRSLLLHDPAVSPQAIFQSVEVFERCVDADVLHLVRSNASSDTLEAEKIILAAIRKKTGYSVLPMDHPLVSSRNISTGQSGSIIEVGKKQPTIQKAILVANTDISFKVRYDVQKEEPLRMSPGTLVRFVFSRLNDGFYGVEVPMISASGSGIIEFGHTLDVKRNQLRQHVRVDTSLPIKFRLIRTVDFDKSDIKKGETIDGKMADISGGGVSFLCSQSCKPGDLVSVSFNMQNDRISSISAKVIRISLQEGKEKDTLIYRHHIQFSSISPGERDKIVKYIFERQRLLNQWR